MPYKHGAYGIINDTPAAQLPQSAEMVPVYIGTAPVHRLANPAAAVNTPVIARTLAEAEAALGYSDDWANFTLCEAMRAHLANAIKPIGPIVLINVMDPTSHITAGSDVVNFTASHKAVVAVAKGERTILSSVAISGKVLGTDFSAEYDAVNNNIIVTDLLSAYNEEADVTIAYNYMDVTKVLASDIVGGTTGGVYKGIACVDRVYQQFTLIPVIIGAPGWSQIPSVYTAMTLKAAGICGKFKAVAVADIDSSDTGAKTGTAALAWKTINGYDSEYAKVCWPKARKGARRYWLSTLAAVRMQQTDLANENIPSASPSNKQIDADGMVCADNSTVVIMSETEANDLNAQGITTMCFVGGNWRLWGPHNANYEYGTAMDPGRMFDASIRMQHYVANMFQARYLNVVDNPMSRREIDWMLNDAQIWLNSLVAAGKLLYAQIAFTQAGNPADNVEAGDFVFDIATTTTPVGKSLTFAVQYSAAGITSLFGGEEA